MESIEEVLKVAIEMLDEEKNAECKKYLKNALIRFRKANTDNQLKYIKELEDTLK